MHRVTVIEFITLDGVVEDPDGSDGTAGGGWAFRFGPEAVGGDKFRLGPLLETGTLLLGRRTWDLFSRLWPERTDPFAQAMNRIPKAVATRTSPDLGAWEGSTALRGDLLDEVPKLLTERDVIVTGSIHVARELMAHDLVDEYRLVVLPVLVGTGRRLFEPGTPAADLRLLSVEPSGAAVLMRHERSR